MMRSPIAETFNGFLGALEQINKIDIDKKNNDLTFRIFYDLFKIRMAQWRYKKNFHREVDYSISGIFQDIFAHYLKAILPVQYEVYCEHKRNRLRPDIVVTKDGKYHSIIEVKTTIGWDRELVANNKYSARIKDLSHVFSVPKARIFYVFEAARNVNRKFYETITSSKQSEMKKFIMPLFKCNAHPFFMPDRRYKDGKYYDYSDKEIRDLFEEQKLNDFKDIVKQKILR
jgi:hypothetical protein